MIYIVGGEKGGPGKSTIAQNLAILFADSGKDVVLVDADTQPTSSNWAAMRREDHKGRSQIACVAIHGKGISHELNALKEKYEIVIVDTGGRDSVELRGALVVADKFIVPLEGQNFSFWTIDKVDTLLQQVEVINPRIKTIVVLSRIPHQKTNYVLNDACEVFKGFPRMHLSMRPIVSRAAFGNAGDLGLAVHEMLKRDIKACTEINALYNEVNDV